MKQRIYISTARLLGDLKSGDKVVFDHALGLLKYLCLADFISYDEYEEMSLDAEQHFSSLIGEGK